MTHAEFKRQFTAMTEDFKVLADKYGAELVRTDGVSVLLASDIDAYLVRFLFAPKKVING